MRLYINGLPPSFTDNDLKELVEPYGDVIYAYIRREKHDYAEIYAVVECRLNQDAREAMLRLNGATVRGYRLTASDEPPKKKKEQ